MKRKLALGTTVFVALAALTTFGYVVKPPTPVTKTHVYRCTDRNLSLHFVIYETDGTLNGGHMYVENMQLGVLKAEQAGTGVIKASVVGNTATNIAFQLHKSGMVMVANDSSNPNRVEVCKASYKYQ